MADPIMPGWLQHLPKKSTLLVALSGGADSLYLLLHLLEITKSHPMKLIAAHVNHGVRGEEADGDAAFVAQICAEKQVPLLTRHLGTLPASDEGSLRAGRLAMLREMAAEAGTSFIALGHHQDDLAETFLLMALRGSGPAGLGSMREISQWPGGITVFRPLLGWRRERIIAALRSQGLEWREDSTNASQRHRRNRLRASILPLLEEMEPAAVEMLARSARLSADAHRDHEEMCRLHLHQATQGTAPAALLLSTKKLCVAPPHRHTGILRLAFSTLLDDQEVSGDLPRLPAHDRLGDLAGSLTREPGDAATFDLGHGVAAWLGCGRLLLHRMDDTTAAFLAVAHALPILLGEPGMHLTLGEGIHPLSGGDLIEVTMIPDDESPPLPRPPWEVVLSLPEKPTHLQMYIANGEDRVTLASGGSKTVAQCLREVGIPPPVRDRVLAVYMDNKPAWIPGVRQAAHTLATQGEGTCRILLKIHRGSG